MADFLSLHWGERIVGVEASISDGVIRVRNSLTVDRSSATDADTSSDPDAESTGEAPSLADALLAAGVSARQVFVVLDQKNVVTRWLELPAVPDEELPELVRWQAGTKSTLSVDQLIVDYLPLPMAEDAETRAVLLATVARDTVSEIRRELSEAGLDLRGVGVGSLALTELALECSDGHSPTDGVVVAADKNQLEVTVHQRGLSVLTHSASLTGESDPVRAAGQAISRALFAVSNSVTDLKLDSAVLMGSLADDLVEIVSGRLVSGEGDPRVDVVSLTDTQQVHFQTAPAEDLAGCPALAAAVGGLLAATGSVSERVDFLDPHQPPPPQRRFSNRTLVRVAVGVALLVGLVYSIQMMGSRKLEARIKTLETKVAIERGKFFGPGATAKKRALPSTSAVDRWEADRVQWLDQLHELSPLIGESDDVILTEVNMSQDVRKGLGRITLTGLANNLNPVTRITTKIRDHNNYSIRPAKLDPNKDRQALYKWRFSKVNILLGKGCRWRAVEDKAPLPAGKTNDKTDGEGGRDQATAKKAETGKAGS